MGLAGFKLKDRDDRKSKSSHHSGHHHHLHLVHPRPIHGHHHSESSPITVPRSPIKPNRSPTLPVPSAHSHLHSQPTTSGWSYILEDWYCRGVGNLRGAKPSIVTERGKEREIASTAVAGASGSPNKKTANANSATNGNAPTRELGSIDLTWETDENDVPPSGSASASASGLTSRMENGDTAVVGQGPYQLLLKERLMGIYLAVFVHRDAARFVEGLSKDTVATGMMRGRIGNKGGVGISMKIAGTTLLFVNAHLAGESSSSQCQLGVLPFCSTRRPCIGTCGKFRSDKGEG